MKDHTLKQAACIGICAASCFAAAAVADVTINLAQSYAVGTQPSGVTIGDFNGDGHLDLASTVDNPDRVVTLINDGTGLYTPGPAFFLPNSSSPQDLLAADFNNDGITDLAVAVRDPVGAVIVLSGTGAGTFTMLGTFNVGGERPRGMSIGDIDGNGFIDIAVANRDSNNASVLFNTGGSFTAIALPVGDEPRATVLADFTGNGMLDLAVTNHDDRTVSVFNYAGGTSFALSQTLSVGGIVRPEGITAADFNNDGFTDLAVALGDNNLAFNAVGIFAGSAAGFTGPVNYPTGGIDTGDIVAADLNCDGWMDLAATNQDSNTVSILENLGGTFAPPLTTPAGINPGRIAAGDLTGNGAPDLAVENRDSNSVTVHANTSEGCDAKKPPVVGDLDGDGTVGIPDLLIQLGEWGPCANCDEGMCPADLNGDCTVGIPDLLILLGNWG